MERVNNYLIQAAQAKERFLTYDQQKLIGKFGLENDDQRDKSDTEKIGEDKVKCVHIKHFAYEQQAEKQNKTHCQLARTAFLNELEGVIQKERYYNNIYHVDYSNI